jgi:hypothetical protein
MKDDAADLSRLLAREAEAVCRHYLPHGRRAGRYWLAGDVEGAPGRSLYVRLHGPDSGPGAAGKWSDAATGEHGDLLDLIAANRKLKSLAEALDEARLFLAAPRPAHDVAHSIVPAPRGSPDAARRLFAASSPIAGTLAEIYLRRRGLNDVRRLPALRFHPRCYHRPDDGPVQTWPALIAAVTDLAGAITGVQRTYLDPALAGARDAALAQDGKAPFEEPRRAIGALLGNGVRFGPVEAPVLFAGEGVETMLSLRAALPGAPLVAGLTANHLAALTFPGAFPGALRRLYVARDADAAGDGAFARLQQRGGGADIEIIGLSPQREDFNVDLRAVGVAAMRRALLPQLIGEDAVRFVLASRPPRGA